MSAHAALRAATREAHDRVDARYSSLNLSDRDDYATFLALHAAAFIPAEEALTRAGAADFIPDWTGMRRADALMADLADLGLIATPSDRPIAYDGTPAILGGAYVLEGSRLGGAMLRRQVGDGLPRRFLDSVQPPGRWRAFVADIDRILYDVASTDRAIASAVMTFALFEQVEWMKARE